MKSQPPAWLFSFESTNLAEKQEEEEEEKKRKTQATAMRYAFHPNTILFKSYRWVLFELQQALWLTQN